MRGAYAGQGRAARGAGPRARPAGGDPSLDGAELPPADLVVSTVTAGAADAVAERVAASAPVVFDAIYAPWPTALAEAAGPAGAR